MAITASPGSDGGERPKQLKQALLGSARIMRSIKKVCQSKEMDAIGSAPPMCLFQFDKEMLMTFLVRKFEAIRAKLAENYLRDNKSLLQKVMK